MSETPWDAAQYLRFGDHRRRPGRDLLAQVPPVNARVVWDLGCGTGELTVELAERFPEARVRGVDRSLSMLEKAAALEGHHETRLSWHQRDITHWLSEPDDATPPDLVFSNAAFHWLEDHPGLLQGITRCLAPGGVLAFQIPLTHHQPSHRLMRDVLVDLGLADPQLIRELERRHVLEPEGYLELLRTETVTQNVWTTTYYQQLTGENAVLQFVESTGLRPVLQALNDKQQAAFLPSYEARLREAYPPTGPVTTFPVKRLFAVATNP